MKEFIYRLRKKIVMAGAALLAVFSLSTCQSLYAALQEPLVSLHSVEITGLSFTGAQLLCKVQVENPNAFDIPFPETGWEFFINANSFISGVIKNNEQIRARRSTLVEVPVNLNYVDIFNTFRSLKGSQKADYKIALAIKFAIPILGDKVWNFEREGEFPVLQLPRLSMPSMRFDSLDFTKADILVSFNVENPNPVDLPPFSFVYNYFVDRNSFIQSSVENNAPLAAAAITPVVIRLSVNYANLYRTFQTLLNSGEAPSLISLSGDFGIPAFSGDAFKLDIPGSLPLLKAPTIRFGNIRVKTMTATNLEIEVNWEVENNNSFAMTVKELGYNLTVNNSNWSSARVSNAPQIAANRRTTVPVTFSINSLSLVLGITDIVTRGTNVTYACSGNFNLGMALPGLSDLNTPFNFSGTTRLLR